MLGDAELILALAVALILFGPERLPEFARQFGEAVNKIRESLRGGGLAG